MTDSIDVERVRASHSGALARAELSAAEREALDAVTESVRDTLRHVDQALQEAER